MDCSFNPSATESVDIGSGNSGKSYIMLVTNFANVNQTINVTFDDAASSGDCACTSLPIILLDFEGENVNNTFNQIRWKVIELDNHDRYKLYTSTTGYDWELIADMKGNNQPSYYYNHYGYENKLNYYKLEQYDLNGFKTVYIDNTINDEKGRIYNILGQDVDENYRGVIFKNVNGKLVKIIQ